MSFVSSSCFSRFVSGFIYNVQDLRLDDLISVSLITSAKVRNLPRSYGWNRLPDSRPACPRKVHGPVYANENMSLKLPACAFFALLPALDAICPVNAQTGNLH